MSSVNMDVVKKQVQAAINSSAGQKYINDAVDSIMAGLGNKKVTISAGSGGLMEAAAKRFIEVVKGEVEKQPNAGRSLGETAVEALTALKYGKPYKSSGQYKIDVNFTGDLHRESLVPERYPRGVDNIVALLNSGYSADHSIMGVWVGHTDKPISSLAERDGLHFIESAVEKFMRSYAASYGITDISVDNEYK